jgi:hypothetical protein
MNETENRHCLKTQALPIFCKTEMKSNFSGRKSKNSYSEISKKKIIIIFTSAFNYLKLKIIILKEKQEE